MAYLFKHAALGSIINYCRTGKISFSRQKAKSISSSSSSDDVTVTEAPLEGKISANHLVTWSGPDDPSNPQNWPMWQKVLVTFILWYVTSKAVELSGTKESLLTRLTAFGRSPFTLVHLSIHLVKRLLWRFSESATCRAHSVCHFMYWYVSSAQSVIPLHYGIIRMS